MRGGECSEPLAYDVAPGRPAGAGVLETRSPTRNALIAAFPKTPGTRPPTSPAAFRARWGGTDRQRRPRNARDRRWSGTGAFSAAAIIYGESGVPRAAATRPSNMSGRTSCLSRRPCDRSNPSMRRMIYLARGRRAQLVREVACRANNLLRSPVHPFAHIALL